MLQNREKKKRKGGRYFLLALLIVALLILLLLFFGEQWGIGQGDLFSLLNMQESPQEEETPPGENLEVITSYREVKVTVAGNTIQVDEIPFTLEGFDAYLVSLEENILIVLVDEEANYTLFTTIEELIEENGVSYVIEE